MPLAFRLATPEDFPAAEKMVIDSFEPITWLKKLDQRYGPLNGLGWRQRWETRFAHAFRTQIALLGEEDGTLAAYASGNYDTAARVGFIDLLAVDRRFQGRGYGREMLRGMIDHFRSLGAGHVNLECLSDNDTGNSLYRSDGFEEVARSIRWWKRL